MPVFDYIKCPIHRYTFFNKPIREWVELHAAGLCLNLFAGKTILDLSEIRNDLDPDAISYFKMDALQFVNGWDIPKFDTIILDPPYAYRKSMELYKGIVCSPFKKLKDAIPRILVNGGRVITFGYHSNAFGAVRGFEIERIGLFSHGGSTHDTIASIEKYNP